MTEIIAQVAQAAAGDRGRAVADQATLLARLTH